MNVVGLAVCYLAVLGVGIVATWWFKKKNKQEFSEEDETETSIVVGRKLGGLVGVFNMIGEVPFSQSLTFLSLILLCAS